MKRNTYKVMKEGIPIKAMFVRKNKLQVVVQSTYTIKEKLKPLHTLKSWLYT